MGMEIEVVVEFTIKDDDDGAEFTKFIKKLRTTLAKHPNHEDILDGKNGSNLDSNTRKFVAELCAAEEKEERKHPLLAKQHAAGELPARWLHVNLQVKENGTSSLSTTTLVIRDDNVGVMGFMNGKGVWYEIGNKRMLPQEKYNNTVLLEWGNSYQSILEAGDAEGVVTELTSADQLGKTFMKKAVRVLSSYDLEQEVDANNMRAQLALVGLMVMVCDSARMNPVLNAIEGNWAKGIGSTSTNKLMTNHVFKYEEMSEALRRWKGRNYSCEQRNLDYYSKLLCDIYLVLNVADATSAKASEQVIDPLPNTPAASQQAGGGGNDDGITPLEEEDLATLRDPTGWLTDEVIRWFFGIFNSKFANDQELLLVPPSISALLFGTSNRETTQDMVERYDLKSRSLVLFAVNDQQQEAAGGGTHWSLLVLDNTDNNNLRARFMHHDSIPHSVNGKVAKQLSDMLREFLPSFQGAQFVPHDPTPEQRNSYDCGVYLLAVAETICEWFSMKDGRPCDWVEMLMDKFRDQSKEEFCWAPSKVEALREKFLNDYETHYSKHPDALQQGDGIVGSPREVPFTFEDNDDSRSARKTTVFTMGPLPDELLSEAPNSQPEGGGGNRTVGHPRDDVIPLKKEDLFTLRDPTGWLTDEVIRWFFVSFTSKFANDDQELLLVPPSISALLSSNHATEQDMAELDLESRSLVLFAVNDQQQLGKLDGGTHWSLLVLDNTEQPARFVHYDTLNNPMNGEVAKKLSDVLKECFPSFRDAEFMEAPTPNQTSLVDSGVYFLEMAETICEWFSMEHGQPCDSWVDMLTEKFRDPLVEFRWDQSKVEASREKFLNDYETHKSKQPDALLQEGVEFTIENDDDGAGFTKFITDLRTTLAKHPNHEDILDGCHNGSNLDSTPEGLKRLRAADEKVGRKHPLLAKRRVGELPARLLHIKLQVKENGPSTTLVIRDDNVDVMGFMNQKGVWYELGNAPMLPPKYNSVLLEWGSGYESILGARDAEEVGDKLASEKLGKAFMTKAVGVLSSYDPGQVVDANNMGARLALVGLMVMACDSARMNPVCMAIAVHWANGMEDVIKQLMTNYVCKYGGMSKALRQWKGRNYVPFSSCVLELGVIYLVLNEEYSMGDILSFSYAETLKASFPEMFNVNVISGVNVEVNLLRGKGWTEKEEIYGKIVAHVSDEQRHSTHFRVGSVLFNHTPKDALKGDALKKALKEADVELKEELNDAVLKDVALKDTALKKALKDEGSNFSFVKVPPGRCVVAVPSGWVLHINVDLHIKIPNIKEPKHLNVTQKLVKGTPPSPFAAGPKGSGIIFQVKYTSWSSSWPIQETDGQFRPQLSSPVEIQRAGNRCHIVYTIGDELSFNEFIRTLRRILADHPGREDLLAGHEFLNLCSTSEHPLLAEFHDAHPKKWHHVKLLVMDSGQNAPTTTLVMRSDNLYVLGFINEQGVLYRLLDEVGGKSVIPEDYYNSDRTKDICCGVSYRRLLGVESSEEIAEKLTGKLGKKFVEEAVRVLSRYDGPNSAEPNQTMTDPTPGEALARLIVMVCESARMNAIYNPIAAGWSSDKGTAFTEEMVDKYIWEWASKSQKLLNWRAAGYDYDQTHHPINRELQDISLVYSKGKGTASTSSGTGSEGRGGTNDRDSRSQSSRKDHGDSSGEADGQDQHRQGGGGSGSSGASGQSPEGNQSRDVGAIQVRGRPRVEILAIRADLTKVGTIIVSDGKQGQIIYTMKEQQQKGKVGELDLTGPYTGISATYGCFEIQINIPDHPDGPIKWKWDCEEESYARQVDYLQPSKYTISTHDRPEIAEVTYAVMSNAREATVQVKLRRLEDGQMPGVVSANVWALIDGFNVKSTLLRGKGTVCPPPSHNDDPWCRLELARNVVAVPCGKALHIDVDLNIEDKNVKVPDIRFENNGIYSKKIYNSAEAEAEVQVEVTWYPKVGRKPTDLVYTTGDEQSFTGFINNLRGCLAEHEDREDIKGCRVLAKQRAEQPARWLHVKLQVVEGKETSWMTLIMRDDDLYVHGFMDQKGFCYELLENKDSSVNMLPENVYSPQPLFWGLNYRTILQVQDDSGAAAKLKSKGLGQSFAHEAVRRLSSFFHPDDKHARLALAGLIVMVCESARFNPVCDALAAGWSKDQGGFTEELMYGYVQKHEEMSWELQAWKSRRLKERPNSMIWDMLEATCLVLNTRKPKVTREERDVLISYAEWHSKIRLELLSIRADLGVVGTKIIILDRKRGQIIYRHEIKEQREPGTMVDLALTRPYTAISPYGCFAIKIDIPGGAAPITWERDCYNPKYAIKIDESVTQQMYNNDGNRIAEVTYAVMSDPLEATVQFKLRLNDGHIPSGISGEISTLIEGFQDKDSRPSILFRRAKGTGQWPSSTGDSVFLLQLDRNVVAVPPKKVLLIKVDLEIETSNGQGVKPLNFKADLRIENGILSQYHVVDGCEVEVNVTWEPDEGIEKIKEHYYKTPNVQDIPEDTKSYFPKAKMIGPPHVREVVYTIGDDKSYDGFIRALRRILTDYQNRDDGILLLSQQEIWLHVKLQVAGEEKMSTTTLFIEYGSLYVHGFMNQSAVWCLDDFTPYDGRWRVCKGVAYSPIFTYKGNAKQRTQIVDRLQSSAILVGKSSAEKAVSVLSDFKECKSIKDDDTIWRALATLKAMVCDSAKINPVHGAIKDGWNNEMRLTKTKELIDYINNWERISGALLQWSAWEEDQELERIGIKTPDDPGRVIHLCCSLTPERIYEPKRLAKAAARDNQTVHSLFGSPTRDYLISNKGDKVPISALEGKYVCVYSVENGYPPLNDFTAVLAKIYDKLKEVGEKFEVVAVPSDNNESSLNESFAKMPWLAIPPGDPMCMKLVRYFWLRPLRTLALIGPDGKTLDNNIADIIQDHGFEAWEGFPFASEKLEILAEKAKAKAAWQSLLVRGELDYVIRNGGTKVPVSDLVGKTVLLYFCAEWCPPGLAFLPTLVKEYNKIKEKNSDFEVVFISNDTDQSSFDNYFFQMPWLALPWKDKRIGFLREAAGVDSIPSLVAIGPTGKIVNKDAKDPLMFYGADAFPFTEERIEELMRSISSS